MVHGSVRKLFVFLGFLLIGALVAAGLLLWRLSIGPISLAFLTPSIEQALSSAGVPIMGEGFTVQLESTELTLRTEERALKIRATGVKAYAKESPQPLAIFPDIAVQFSLRALLNGTIAVKTIELNGPKLRYLRDETGKFQWSAGENSAPGVSSSGDIAQIFRSLEEDSAFGRYFQRLIITRGEVTFVDGKTGSMWRIPALNLSATRLMAGASASAVLELEQDGQKTQLIAEAFYYKADQRYKAALKLVKGGFRPASLAALSESLADAAVIDLPLTGTIQIEGALTAPLPEEMIFDLVGGAGTVDLSKTLKTKYHLRSLALRGRVFSDLTRVRIEKFAMDLNGTQVEVTGTVDGIGHGPTVVAADALVTHVPMDALSSLWPPEAAVNAREWVVHALSKGVIKQARASLVARSPSGRFDDVIVEGLLGEFSGEGATVDYLPPMPPAKGVAATATFDATALHLTAKAGEVAKMKIEGGTVSLLGLDKEVPSAVINLTTSGAVKDGLKLIDNSPLQYASALGVTPASAGGTAEVKLGLKFPLLKDLRLDALEVAVHASAKNVSLPKVALGLDLKQADLEMDVDVNGLDASGPIVLGTIAGNLKWRENFSKNSPFDSRYEFQSPRVTEAQRKELGLGGPPFVAPFVSGPVSGTMVATLKSGGTGDIEAKVDLSPATMTLPGLGWRKEERATGAAEVSLRLEKGKIAKIPLFKVMAGDLQTTGSVAFTAGRLTRVDFTRLAYGGRTDVAGSLSFRANGKLDVAARGKSFNAEPVLANDQPKSNDPALPPMSIKGTVETLWLSGAGKVSKGSVVMERNARDWQTMAIEGGLGKGKTFRLTLKPEANQRRSLVITSDDAGALLKASGSYDSMVEGKLRVEAFYDDSKNPPPLTGTVFVEDYQIVNAPALARLLTVAALTGILDLLQDQGVSFAGLEAPFVFENGLLTLSDARIHGPALGLTAKGQVDLEQGRVALEGTIVPAYALNSALGHIPILGWLITGGEKGSGLIAFRYTMKGPAREPSVSVNPLSGLTPGFLRNLFNVFDDGSETEARPAGKRP